MNQQNYSSEEVSAILKIIDDLNTHKDVDTILDRILTESRRLAGAEAGSIFLVQDKKFLVFSYVQNESLFNRESSRAAQYLNLRVPISHESIVGHVAMTREPLTIDDAYHLPPDVPYRFNTSFDEEHGYRTVSMMTLPLLTLEDRLVGVMQLINAKDENRNIVPFSEHNKVFVTFFANNAAVTIERAVMNRELILRMMSMAETARPRGDRCPCPAGGRLFRGDL